MNDPSAGRDRLVRAYRLAKQHVLDRGHSAEIEWQDSICFDRVTEQEFLAEAAWVVLSSGMREKVIRKVFGDVSDAFHGWRSATAIVCNADSCITAALKVFGHRRKIAAIVDIAATIDRTGFEAIKEQIAHQGVDRLRGFPYIGPATSYHLAKNLGLDVAKPDRHLIRIAHFAGYSCPEHLCRDLSGEVGDRISVVDLVLWRFATLVPRYLDHFAEPSPVIAGPADASTANDPMLSFTEED